MEVEDEFVDIFELEIIGSFSFSKSLIESGFSSRWVDVDYENFF